MHDDIERNLDTQRRRLDELDAAIDAALSDDEPGWVPDTAPHHQSYTELTTYNDQLRAERGWTAIDLDAALTDTQREALDRWRDRHRLTWTNADLAAVGAVAVIGLLCSWFDGMTDATLVRALKSIDISGLEAVGKRLPIDYMGPGFGGQAHRIKSAGHDLARAITALHQIKKGEFQGVVWQNGQQTRILVSERFRDVGTWEEALTRLVAHLGADVITPMSLPIPGMSYLAECDNAALRQFAVHAYKGLRPGEGWNLRSGLVTPTLPVFLTEVIIRTHVHGQTWHSTGSAQLDAREIGRRNELLLAGHSLVAAVSVAKTGASIAAQQLVGVPAAKAFHPSQIRHLNLPALLRAGSLAVTVTRQEIHRRNIPSAPSWEQLLATTAQPWQLELADHLNSYPGSDLPTFNLT